MKLTIVKKATTSKKPSNFCPWLIDDIAMEPKK
jgi:hypothetical protein